jgi:hypothetical protein
MAGWTRPRARALESFEPWRDRGPIDCSVINAALTHAPEYEAERAAWYEKCDRLFAPFKARQRAQQEAMWARDEAEGRA